MCEVTSVTTAQFYLRRFPCKARRSAWRAENRGLTCESIFIESPLRVGPVSTAEPGARESFRMPVAFKEWAVTVRALAEGEQLLTLRKGGIREENRHFEIEHDRFFLYPTFDHQRNDLVKQAHQPELPRALEEGVWSDGEPSPRGFSRDGGIPQPDRVRIRAWAEVAASYLITDPRCVDALSPYYVWNEEYMRDRLRWKPRHPLHVILLRTYRIPRPVTVKVRDEYIGCHSWLELQRELPFEGTPVLSDEEFARVEAEIEEIAAEAVPVIPGRRDLVYA